MQDLIIVCEDTFGLAIRLIVDSINSKNKINGKEPEFFIKGFICPDGTVLPQNEGALPVLGTITDWQPSDKEVYAMGIIEPNHKETAVNLLKSKGAKFISLWAPWVLAPSSVKYGEGCIIAAHSIKKDAVIHDYVTLFHSMVANAEIGSFSSLMSASNITNAHIGNKCYIGDNAAVMLNLNICDNVYVLPNSIIVKHVKTPGKLFGIPARKVKGIK